MRKVIGLSIIRLMAITGNIGFVFWILYNGINEGFKGTIVEQISYISLMLLLSMNALLLIFREKPG